MAAAIILPVAFFVKTPVVAPGLGKEELKKEIKKVTQSENVVAKSPQLPPEIKEKFQDPKNVKKVTYKGKLEVLLADSGNAAYQMQTPEGLKDVYFKADPGEVKSSEVQISGLTTEDVLLAETIVPMGEVVKPSVIGTETALVILHTFSNLNFLNNSEDVDDSISKAAIENNAITASNSSRNFFTEASYGNLAVNFTVTNQLASSYDSASGCSTSGIRTAAEAAAATAGFNAANYDHVVYVFPYMPTCTLGGSIWAGLGSWPGRYVYLNGYYDQKTIAHELGHNLGLGHANNLECGSSVVGAIPPCSEAEYGDYYDTMGWGYDHFNAIFKDYLGWLPGKVQTVSTSGTYTLYPLEDVNNNVKTIKIAKPNTNNFYYLEYRQPTGFDANLLSGVTGGVVMHLGKPTGADTQLLDLRPGLSADWDNISLTDGGTYTDSTNDLTITQNSHNGTSVTLSISFSVKTPVYRFYNLKNGTHFYTASWVEKQNVIQKWPGTYKYEGVAYYLDESNTDPLYRLWNTKGFHFYTISWFEATEAVRRWPATYSKIEGVAYNVSTSVTGATSTIYRFYNKKNGSHFYTASKAERDIVIQKWPATYVYEGARFYVK